VTEEIWIFAYGSNMNLGDLRRWLAENGVPTDGILKARPATLPGYRTVWNYRSKARGGGAANITQAVGRDLPGVALRVDGPTLAAIDKKEGHPEVYSRGNRRHAILLGDATEVEAWVYVARPERCSDRGEWPRREYLDLLLDGARKHGLPPWRVRELEVTPTFDDQ
jgi:gamma-glutamylcyclotransferase (GGCT)/AIG2-like uncharacterized protein YtfP